MYGEYRKERATQQIATFYGASANPAKLLLLTLTLSKSFTKPRLIAERLPG